MRGFMVSVYEDVALWRERDISYSSAECVILPDATIGIDYILNRFNRILVNLDVLPETMLKNMDRTYGSTYSQRVFLRLIGEAGLSYEKAYDMMQKLANKSWQEQISFKKLVEDSEIMNYLSEADLDGAFDYHYHLRHVDEVFEKYGLGWDRNGNVLLDIIMSDRTFFTLREDI